MNSTPDPAFQALTRRRVLQMLGIGAAGVAGMGALDACAKGGTGSGNGNGNGGGGGGNGKGGGPYEFHGGWPYQLPPAGHYNIMPGVLNGILAGTPYMDLMCLRGAFLLWSENKYEASLAEKWGFGANNTYTYTIKKGLKWSDGKPVTSKDVASTFWCRRIMRQTEWQYFDDLKVKDDYTVEFHMNVPSTVVEYRVLTANILSDATFGKIAQQAEALYKSGKTVDDPEGKPVNDALQKLRPDNIIVNGPFAIDPKSVTNAQLTLEKNKTGYLADKVQFDKIIIYKGETIDIAPIVAAKKIDYATHGFSVAQENSFINAGIRILRPATYAGLAIYINYDKNPELKDPVVRRAMAHAIDRKAAGEFSLGKSGKGVEKMVGFSGLQTDKWLTPDAASKIDPYEYDQDKAAKLLESVGWKRSGGKWVAANGKAPALEIAFQSDYADYAPGGKNVAEQLSKFGLATKQRGVVSTQLVDDTYKGNFSMVTQGWGAGNPHPSFAFIGPFLTYNYPIAVQQGGRGINFPLKQNTKAYGQVDIQQLVKDCGLGMDVDKQKEQISKLAVIFNELLPVIPIFERFGNNACLEGARVKKWPADNDPLLQNGPYNDNFAVILMLRGSLQHV